jgi:hypothetical protein
VNLTLNEKPLDATHRSERTMAVRPAGSHVVGIMAGLAKLRLNEKGRGLERRAFHQVVFVLNRLHRQLPQARE